MVIRHLGSWQNFTASALNWDDEPYLDNRSLDGGNRNVDSFPDWDQQRLS